MLCGYYRRVDDTVMRVMDGLMAIPAILLAIALITLMKASLAIVIIAISIPEIPRVVRLVRSVVLSVRGLPYIEAAVSNGTRSLVIMTRHILPSTVAPLIVQATYVCASAILTEAGLSFLGAGTPPEIPSWGERHLARPDFFPDRAVDHLLSGRDARDHGARGQPCGRRVARLARSAHRAADVRMAQPTDPVLSVRGLSTQFFTRDGIVRAVDGLSFDVQRGETLGIVGESGCGKSVSALSIMRLIPANDGRIVAGSVKLEGTELTGLSERQMRGIRGNRISMIFQEPMTSLNPVLDGGRADFRIAAHSSAPAGPRGQRTRHRDAGDRAHCRPPAAGSLEYPHQLSGGMRQRVMIAMALACNPQVLIADEPTTALDVTIQAQILNLMLELKQRLGTAIVLITHDLGVIAETAQRAIVMYAGRKVEEASVAELFRNPVHPYTRGLINSIPRRTAAGRRRNIRGRLAEISGIVPSLREEIAGCAFAPRCSFAVERCTLERPPLDPQGEGHLAACWEAARVGAAPR